MRVLLDEARRDEAARGVDFLLALGRQSCLDLDDPTAANPHIRFTRGTLHPIDDETAANQ